MPLLKLKCDQGHEWEALKSISTHDPDADRCPTCLSTKFETMVQTASFHREAEVLRDDIPGLLANKADLERNSEKILSGEIGILERGPKEYRPQLPESMRKRYY